MRNDKPKDMKETFFLGGTIRVGGPDIAARLKKGEEVSFRDHEEGIEFDLGVENRLRDQLLEASPFINMADADVDISTTPPDLEHPECGLGLTFRAGEGRTLELLISYEQALVVGQFCEAYTTAYKAFERLTLTHHINAPEDRDEAAGVEIEAPAVRPVS